MPKKDPITGVEVLTEGEFWQREADVDVQGRPAAELRDEFWEQWERDRKSDEDSYWNDQAKTLEMLQKAVKDWNDSDPDVEQIPMPEKITKILDVRVKSTMRESGLMLQVLAVSGGQEGKYTLTSTHYAASGLNPPESDENIQYEIFDGLT